MQCPFSKCAGAMCKPSQHIIFILVLILSLGIFFSGTNQSLFLAINSMHGMLPVIVWKFLNMVSYSKYMILPVILLAATFVWRKEKLANVILLIFAYFAVFTLLKILFHEARPYIVLNPDNFYWLNAYEDATRSAYRSYPSGHVGNMAVFAFAISSMFCANRRMLQLLLLLLVVLTGLSRICTGWHWPLDVLSSGLIGYLLVKICLCIKFRR